MELALAILAILLSLPALFLSLYSVVLIKSREIAGQLNEQAVNTWTDSGVARELRDDPRGVSPSSPGMYDIGQDDDPDFDEVDI